MSVNVCDSETTPLHVVFEEVCRDAKVHVGTVKDVCTSRRILWFV